MSVLPQLLTFWLQRLLVLALVYAVTLARPGLGQYGAAILIGLSVYGLAPLIAKAVKNPGATKYSSPKVRVAQMAHLVLTA